MKGTTLTELNRAYENQGWFIAGRCLISKLGFKRATRKIALFDYSNEVNRQVPRGKAYRRIMMIESQREASNAGN